MSARTRELFILILVGLITATGFASVYIARQNEISPGSLSYAGFFFALYLIAHLVARVTVPDADPYLLADGGALDRDRADRDLPARSRPTRCARGSGW